MLFWFHYSNWGHFPALSTVRLPIKMILPTTTWCYLSKGLLNIKSFCHNLFKTSLQRCHHDLKWLYFLFCDKVGYSMHRCWRLPCWQTTAGTWGTPSPPCLSILSRPSGGKTSETSPRKKGLEASPGSQVLHWMSAEIFFRHLSSHQAVMMS